MKRTFSAFWVLVFDVCCVLFKLNAYVKCQVKTASHTYTETKIYIMKWECSYCAVCYTSSARENRHDCIQKYINYVRAHTSNVARNSVRPKQVCEARLYHTRFDRVRYAYFIVLDKRECALLYTTRVL